MPIRPEDRARYPTHWPEIRANILTRADHRCEWICADGRRCNAPDRQLIFRLRRHLEHWRYPHGADLGESDPDYKAVDVVLTVAHLNHTPEDCRPENLAAWCQLHHLRYDHAHHQVRAKQTKRKQRNNRDLYDAV